MFETSSSIGSESESGSSNADSVPSTSASNPRYFPKILLVFIIETFGCLVGLSGRSGTSFISANYLSEF